MAVDIRTESAADPQTIAYIPRMMATTSMPSKRLETNEFVRKNGIYRLTMLAPSHTGLPYGTYPRLILLWLTTQAKITRSKEITIGSSVNAFMKSLGKTSTGGTNGSLTSLREQCKRLFSTSIAWECESDVGWSIENLKFVKEAAILWEPRRTTNWTSKIILDSDFFAEISSHSIPVDLRVVMACSHYPLALDIYFWLTFRFYRLRRPAIVSWIQVSEQFGSIYKCQTHFRTSFCAALARVCLYYTDANVATTKSGVLLFPSRTHISPSLIKGAVDNFGIDSGKLIFSTHKR